MADGLTTTDWPVQSLENSPQSQALKLCKFSLPISLHCIACLPNALLLLFESLVFGPHFIQSVWLHALTYKHIFLSSFSVMSRAMTCVEQSQQKDLLYTFLWRSKFLDNVSPAFCILFSPIFYKAYEHICF